MIFALHVIRMYDDITNAMIISLWCTKIIFWTIWIGGRIIITDTYTWSIARKWNVSQEVKKEFEFMSCNVFFFLPLQLEDTHNLKPSDFAKAQWAAVKIVVRDKIDPVHG